jgi:hypothetical protein
MSLDSRLCIASALVLSVWMQTSARAQAIGGVYIDPAGVLRQTASLSQNERLELLRKEAAGAVSSRQVGRTSELRCVSLKRLQQIAAELSRQGKAWPADVRYMAGLQSVTHVFFFPDEGDVVLSGRAEAWTQLPSGEVVGRTSGRPVLHLDDLIVGLRYALSRKTAPFIGCSIEPTAQGMQNYVAYMNNLGAIDRRRVQQIFAGMARAMGMQAIRLYGIDSGSRFALTMVAADYRLKRISLGHDPSPVKKITSYLDLSARGSAQAAQKQHRWWFVAEFDEVVHSADELAWELKGQGVKVVTARNLPGTAAAQAERPTKAARQVADTFTRYFPAMAAQVPVFAELQNAIGLAVVAELIAERRRQGADGAWQPDFFLDRDRCRITQYAVPTQVPSISDFRYSRGRGWITSVSGGVEISPARVVGREFRRQSDDRVMQQSRTQAQLPTDDENWWWDS